MFNEKDTQRMEGFLTLSHIAGSRADYVQGGGGNTSVKLEDGTMAIKASGFCLKDIEMDNAFALLDGNALRNFYREHNPEDFEDCEKSGAQCTKDNIKTIEGLPLLRPSVEAGFHSILKTYVLHTHSGYANLAACAVEGLERVRLGSLEPDFITDEVISRMKAQPKLCPQFHLALQSGCDATL